jgi:hypothetical protein
MRFNEFEKDARKQVAESYNMSEEQLDEILPAIGAVGAGLARVAGTAAVRGGAALARGAVKGAGALARGAAKVGGAAARGAGRAAKGAGRAVNRAAQQAARSASQPNSPNATVGTQSTGGAQLDPAVAKELDKRMKPGKMLDLPSKTAAGKPGPTKKFKVTRNARGEVELQNPAQKPGEPKKFVYNKNELAGILDAG